MVGLFVCFKLIQFLDSRVLFFWERGEGFVCGGSVGGCGCDGGGEWTVMVLIYAYDGCDFCMVAIYLLNIICYYCNIFVNLLIIQYM